MKFFLCVILRMINVINLLCWMVLAIIIQAGIIPSPERARKNSRNEENARRYYHQNHSMIYIYIPWICHMRKILLLIHLNQYKLRSIALIRKNDTIVIY